MITQMLKQIWSEKSRNGWIFAELLIIFSLTWYLVDYAFVMIHNAVIPIGADVSNVYRVSGFYPKDGEEIPADAFLKKLSDYPGVNGYFVDENDIGPFNSSYSGTNLSYPDTLSARYHIQIKKIPSNDYFDVFRIHSDITNRPAHLDLTQEDKVIVSRDLADTLFGDESPVGTKVYVSGHAYTIVDVVPSQKRSRYALPDPTVFFPDYSGTQGQGYNSSFDPSTHICIRVGANFDPEAFREDFDLSISSYETIGDQKDAYTGTKKGFYIREALMLFFLFSVSLGVIGTFWFRNQSRRSEIGIRLAVGASRRRLIWHYTAEALCLLTLAALGATVVDWLVVEAELLTEIGGNDPEKIYLTSHVGLRFVITTLLTYVLLGTIVALSAWIPAYRAGQVNPVEALKDE